MSHYNDQLKSIAETGVIQMDWSDLQKALKMRLSSVLDEYMQKNPDSKEEQCQEPNVEKFNMEQSRDEILELIESFNEAPFTIQRICELLHSPLTYYDRVSTFLRGLEKNLRVISANDSIVDPAGSCSTNSMTESQVDPPQPVLASASESVADTVES